MVQSRCHRCGLRNIKHFNRLAIDRRATRVRRARVTVHSADRAAVDQGITFPIGVVASRTHSQLSMNASAAR